MPHVGLQKIKIVQPLCQGARAWKDGRFLQQLHPLHRCSWCRGVVQGRLQDVLSQRAQVDYSWNAIWVEFTCPEVPRLAYP